MAKLEIDYSLPYNEAKKKYGRNGYFMSEDQYNFNKASAEKQAKMNAAKLKPVENKIVPTPEGIEVYAEANAVKNGTTPEEEKKKILSEILGKGSWALEEGEADKVLQEATGKENPTKDDVQKSIQGIIDNPYPSIGDAKGNPGDDHINNPNEADTADLVKVKQALEKLYGQKDSYTPEEIEAAKNEAGITKNVPGSTSASTDLADTVTEVTTPKEDDPSDVISDKNKYNKSMMSIWDAYRAGEISKETAGYFTIDAIATLAKNLGRSIGNVGAQFSGGTIDNGHDESKWGQRQNALLNEEIGKETESLGGAAGRKAESESLDIVAKRIRNAYTPAQLEQQIEMFKKDLEMADINLDMAHSRTDLINFIKKDPDYAKSPFKMGLVAYLTQAGVGGATNSTAKTLGDAINWILTFAK